MEKETWLDIPGYEGRYQVSDLGRVRATFPFGGCPVPRIRTPWKNSRGYLTVTLCTPRSPKEPFYIGRPLRTHRKDETTPIGRLVVMAFRGKIPHGSQVTHINGDKTDNRLENLEVITPQESRRRARQAGRLRYFGDEGFSIKRNKIPEDIVARVLEDYLVHHVSKTVLVHRYNLSKATIYRICSRRSR